MNREDVLRALQGVIPAVVTPMLENGTLDIDGFEANLHAWNPLGLTGYLVLGSTGETPLLTEFEQGMLVQIARRTVPHDRLLLVGTGRNSTAATIEATLRAAEAGADAVLVVAPTYYTPQYTQSALRRHYEAVADASPVPVLLYNIPQFTHITLSPALVADLATHPNIVGIKDSSGAPASLLAIRRATPPTFRILNGSAVYALGALLDGAADGLILALANIAPETCVALFNAARAGRIEEARRFHSALLALNEALAGTGIGGIKAGVEARGWAAGPPRPPLSPVDEAQRARIAAAVAALP